MNRRTEPILISRSIRLILSMAAVILIGTGCMQIETTIELHDDGSGTITERLNFSRKLLDAASSAEAGLKIENLLKREAALARMKHMGKGVTLHSHKVSDGHRASKESLTVFKIPQLKDFVYISPFIQRRDNPDEIRGIKTVISPVLQDDSSLRFFSGWVRVDFRQFNVTPRKTKEEGQLPVEPRTPLASQTLRDLRPVFKDMMEGLEIKVVFKSYSPINKTLFGWRDSAAKTHKVDLINFVANKHMDAYGYPILENEEIVIDLLRWDLNSLWILSAVRDWPKNKTLPVFHHGGPIFFSPSRHYFDKWFKGKNLKYYIHGKLNQRPAKFEQIGWSPKKK